MDLHIKVDDVDLGEVAEIYIVEDPGMRDEAGATTRYFVKMVVDRGSTIGIHRLTIDDWPRDAINAVGLIRAALNKFDTDTLAYEVDDDTDGGTASQDQAPNPPVVERGLGRVVRAIQAWEG